MPRTFTDEDVQEIKEVIGGELSKDLSRDIEEVMATAIKKMGLETKNRLPMNGDPEAEGAELNGKFKSFREFLNTAYLANNKGVADARLKVLAEAAGDTGGFLVPEQFRAELLNDSLETAFFRPRARVIPITGPTNIPRVNVTTHATSVFGGVVAYWRKEGATLSADATQPSFGQVHLTPKELIGYTQASNILLADAALSLEPILRMMFAEALTFYEEEAFVNGDGAGEPVGILQADATVSVAKETGQAATTIVAENLDKMYSRLLPRSQNRAVWLAHPDTFPQLAALSRAVGTGGNSTWVTNMAGGPPTTIYGRPVIFTEHCQTVGTTGDIYLVDLSYYLIADRQALAVSSSEHVRFAQNETVWRFIQRLDGQPWLNSAITPKNGSNTLSPFVKLDTRA